MMSKEVHVLLVDDDDVDIQGLKRSFKAAKIANPVYVARDGVEALEMLRGENGHTPLPKPHVILLDLNMPRMNGIEFLEEIRRDEQLHRSIVFVLTTSNSEQDVCQAYRHHVAGYVVKPDAAQGLIDALSMLDHYWRIIELPR